MPQPIGLRVGVHERWFQNNENRQTNREIHSSFTMLLQFALCFTHIFHFFYRRRRRRHRLTLGARSLSSPPNVLVIICFTSTSSFTSSSFCTFVCQNKLFPHTFYKFRVFICCFVITFSLPYIPMVWMGFPRMLQTFTGSWLKNNSAQRWWWWLEWE